MEVVTIGLVLIGILCFFLDSLSAGRIVGDLIALISGLFYAGVFMLNSSKKGMHCPPCFSASSCAV